VLLQSVTHTIVDRTLDDFDQLWAAGGIPHAVFPLTYDELIKLTGGVQSDVS
jgi:prolyl-tRNA editing enzyme YbaK/EbsC (Cys-tRNA(Pro) deacylase)